MRINLCLLATTHETKSKAAILDAYVRGPHFFLLVEFAHLRFLLCPTASLVLWSFSGHHFLQQANRTLSMASLMRQS
jgi:hypothetical protein